MAISKLVSYSLGNAIDWKRCAVWVLFAPLCNLLLARGRDRLETPIGIITAQHAGTRITYSLGDAIYWKHEPAEEKLSQESTSP
ncbi:MAG: hypothetical protein ACK56Y_07720, partial [Pseudanabaena sp.]